ncbi:MAG TPA: bifunctional serine/threonine-protein kinase/formylglycine-generating enzyme family protein [Candidatus Hydrogenedentes bacterium]|nr:bifunctional serine/threonine-protein kinase/formylglycine-generating enzyme family protein [Candidatus Hydrogenedentota bacterium]
MAFTHCVAFRAHAIVFAVMIGVTCSNCGTEILVPPTVQGKPGICFGCGAALRVPDYSNIPRLRELVFSAGDRIANRYSIEERIGQGGMGVVYRAKDTLVDEEVALKFLKPQLLRTQQGLATFIQEAQIARRLRHDNIVAVHDISWTSEGILFLSMEFLRGQSLRALLRRHRSERRLLDVRFAVHVSACILDALAHAHRTVVHRDLKPENIMILPGEHVKVLDFGLAMAIEEESARNARNGTAAGTFAYAAPEQKRGQAVDLRADLYTVGLIFYELLTLRTPIDEQIPIPNIRRDVSPSLMDILARALTPDRAERWPSASAFRRALLQAFEQSYRAAATTPSAYTPSGKASTEGMVYLEGGSFLMGNDLIVEEAPQFEAHVEPFYMDIYPVTVKQYRAFLEATGRPAPRSLEDPNYSGPNQPVVGVTWDDANAYAAWAGKRLPTEAQWEFAARGKENRPYPWGHLEPDTNHCNFRDYLSMPSIVTMHAEGRTPEGIYDMGGNVYEWTLDAFVPYKTAIEGRMEESRTPLRSVRGGCWNSPAQDIRCTHRKGLFPESRLNTVGFRCVLPAQS